MEQIQVRCRNTGGFFSVPVGSTLSEVFSLSNAVLDFPPLCAKVNNRVRGMDFRLYNNKDVEFLNICSNEGMRVYTRTLFFVLSKAVDDLFPGSKVKIDTPVSNGYYCDVSVGRSVTLQDVERIKKRMEFIIGCDFHIERHNCTMEEATDLFERRGSLSKVKLLRTSGKLYTTYYQIDDYPDYYYGPLLCCTGELGLFGLEKYFDGILLRVPSQKDPSRLVEMVRQDMMFDVFKEHHRWQNVLRMETVGDFNDAVRNGHATSIVNISEALQEKKIAKIAEEIANRKDVRLVLIAGPSSSGKTTTSKRLSIQLLCNGIEPFAISLDDYFVNRDETPKDEYGDYDYEHLHALNLDLLNMQLKKLFNGESVYLPKYDFHTGTSCMSDELMQLKENEVLILEGIHALNPELTKLIPDNQKYRIYASALTTILLDNHNYISTTDNRLLRRMIRDHKQRGVNAQETIRRWPSVRKGENRWIFPFQENADAMFNTAMIYELGVIRNQALPLLQQIPENSDQYSEAHRLMNFLNYIQPISEDELPYTSLLREFVGGSTFKY